MNKKIIGVVVAIIVIVAVVAGFMIYNKNSKSDESELNVAKATNESEKIVNDTNDVKNEVDDEENEDDEKKILVVYFSAQSHTKAIAEKIADNLDANIFEIEPKEKYTSDDLSWNNGESRVSKEHEDESLRDVELVTTKIDDWDDYDTVLIGYPIWWGISAWPMNTFVKANDFDEKTVIPFCTSGSSGLGESGKLLEEEANGGNWLEGHRFSSSASDSDIKNWTDSLK